MRRSRGAVAALLGVLATSACAPTCERTCKKLLDCGNLDSQRVSVAECEVSCTNQLGMYDGWIDEEELEQAFDDHRRCLVRTSCDAIEAGECYDDRLFQVGVEVTPPVTTPTGSLTGGSGL